MKNRLNSIDILRCVAALLVVCIHCKSFWGREFIVHISIIAVPLFFMISGYFYELSTKEKRKQQILRVLILNICTNVIYLLYTLIISLVNHNTLNVLKEIFSLKSIAKFLLINVSPVMGHLWYLSAFLYCLIIYKILADWQKQKILYYVVPVLLLGSLVFGEYSLVLLKKELSYTYVRNFLFIGIPYFTLGSMFTKVKKEDIKTPNFVMIIAMVVLVLLSLGEKNLLISMALKTDAGYYISTTLLTVVIFVFALKNPISAPNKALRKIAKIGSRYTLMIYIIHPLILRVIEIFIEKLNTNIQMIYMTIMPVIIFLLALAFSVIYYRVKEKLVAPAE